MNHKPRINCVIVTYNRKNLLLECLEAVYSQTYPIQKVILINNASTDGTEEALKEAGYFGKSNFDYHLMPKNLGGSGGFYEGIKISRDYEDSEWCWIMDDDTIPFSDALEYLVKSAGILGDGISFVKSTQYDADNNLLPVGGLDTRGNGHAPWNERLSEGFLKVRGATFVSLLVNSKAIEKCGLPCKDYFIWADDTEYCLRLTEYYGPGYFDGHSKVCHKRPTKTFSVLTEADSPRLNNYYYLYRNTVTNIIIYESRKSLIKHIIRTIITAIKAFAHPPRFKRFRIIMSGMFSGLFTWRKYYKFIQSQVKA